MKISGKGLVLISIIGIMVLGGGIVAYSLKKGGAKGGRDYIEENSADRSGQKSETSVSITLTLEDGNEGSDGEEVDKRTIGHTAAEGETGRETADKERAWDDAAGTTSDRETKDDENRRFEDVTLKNEIVMLFAGDVYLSNHVLNAYDKAGGIQGILEDRILEEIQKADIFMVNQEFPFTQRGTAAEDKQFTFRVPESRIHLMQEMGIDIVTLANNHILDFGKEGLLDSCKALDEAGILYVGGGEDLERAKRLETIIVGQKIIGFLGTSRVYMDSSWAAGNSHPGVFSTYDATLPLKAIEEARKECDYLVVYVHWGIERKETPEDYQRAMGKAYIDAGADLVVGSHPHVLQEIEEYNGKTIVYSLGNFVFGSSIPKTALLKVVWGEDGTEVSLIPCTSSGGFTRLAE